MADIVNKKHTLFIEDCTKLSINGIVNVESISDKEVEIKLPNGSLTIKGSNLNANKLSIEDGTIIIDCEAISSVNYSKGNAPKEKFKFSSLFK